MALGDGRNLGAPSGKRGRPTREEQAKYGRGGLKGYLARLEKERLEGGVVLTFLWQGKLYCSTDCILAVNGLVYADTPLGREIDQWNEDNPMFRWHEAEPYGPQRTMPRGEWWLTRYEVRRFFKVDVAHFKCPGGDPAFGASHGLRVVDPRSYGPKAKRYKAEKREAWRDRKRARNRAYREGLKARKAEREARWKAAEEKLPEWDF